jgi:hypothetical protein
MVDAADFRRFFRPSIDHPDVDVFSAERAFAATPALVDGHRLHAEDASWSHLPLPAGVLHPALLAIAAEAYDADAAEVREAADCGGLEGGPLCTLVPIAPPSFRPLARGVGGRHVENAVDARLRRLMRCADVTRRLIERGEDEALVMAARGEMQRAFDALVPQIADGDDSLWMPAPSEMARLRPAGAPPPLRNAWQRQPGVLWLREAPHPRWPIACAIAGDRLLVVFPFAFVVLDRAGRVTSAERGANLLLAYAGDGLARFWREGRAYVFSVTDGRWLDTWPEARGAALVEGRGDEAWLVDARAGRRRELFEVARDPRVARASPDGAYFWVEDDEQAGGVFDAARGLLQIAGEELSVTPSEEGMERREATWGAPDHAFVVTSDERLRFFAVDTLYADGAHSLPFAAAAAFSLEGDELLCVDAEELRLYDVGAGAPALRLRLDLPMPPATC